MGKMDKVGVELRGVRSRCAVESAEREDLTVQKSMKWRMPKLNARPDAKGGRVRNVKDSQAAAERGTLEKAGEEAVETKWCKGVTR